MAAVDVESLTITYGRVTAVDRLTFSAEAGEVTCVLGPNGAGKTSTVEALEGLRRPASGRLAVVGLDPRADHRALTERMGVMLQDGGIHPGVRVGEALRHGAALYRRPVDPGGLVERLGLSGLERRTYRQLSGGEQRRLALALALVGRPQVAFLDEPTAGVDPAGRQVIRQVIADLRGEGVTVLLTTHDIDEAERVSDQVVIVDRGRLVAAGTVGELTRASGADANVRFRAPAGLDSASLGRYLGGADVAEVAPGDYLVAAAPTPQTVAAITGWLAIHDLPLADLRAGRQRLEDVYLRLTAAGPATEPSAKPPAAPTTEPSGPGPATEPAVRPPSPGDTRTTSPEPTPGDHAAAAEPDQPGAESGEGDRPDHPRADAAERVRPEPPDEPGPPDHSGAEAGEGDASGDHDPTTTEPDRPGGSTTEPDESRSIPTQPRRSGEPDHTLPEPRGAVPPARRSDPGTGPDTDRDIDPGNGSGV